jgi:ATP-dependent exoDNAse (exonuclease V) beta subunit
MSHTDFVNNGGLTVYRASAGSGKTYTLTREYLKQALAGNNAGAFRSVLAVTFTNKATEEMKSRIVGMLNGIATGDSNSERMAADLLAELNISMSALRERAKNVRTALLHDYSRFSISTIDKFFQKVLHAFVREAGLRPGFRLELDSERLLDEAVDRIMLNLHNKVSLYQWFSELIDERMERGSAWDVRDMLKTKGKTVFSETFRSFGEDFYRKIGDADFMNDYISKLEKIRLDFETGMKNIATEAIAAIESANLTKSDFYKGTTVNYFYNICKDEYEPTASILEIKQWHATKASTSTIQAVESISGTLDALRCRALDLYEHDYTAYCTALCVLKTVKTLSFLSEIETNVRDIAMDDNLMPISETVHLLEKLIDGNETPFIYERIGNRYGSFMIDEFQDTSHGQWNNFKPLINNSLSENKFSMLVGDVKQAIYRWRNGDWGILADIENDFRSFGVTDKHLDTNYRSCGHVIEFNNTLFDGLPEWVEREFNGSPENSDFPSKIFSRAYEVAAQKIREDKRDKGYVCVTCVFDDDESKAEQKITENLPQLIAEIQDRGYLAGDIAVLVRNSNDGREVSRCLLEHKQTSGDTVHNFNIVSQDSLYVGTSESVCLIVALLRATVNPDDEINNAFINRALSKKSSATLLNESGVPANVAEKSNLAFNWQKSKTLSDEIKSVLSNLASLSLPEVFEELIVKFGLGDDADEISFIQEFHDEIVNFSYNKLSDISAFLDYWDKEKSATLKLSTDKMPEAISIITIHKSKGLEFPVVIIPYCDWDMKPRVRSTLWVKPETEPFSELPHVPVEYVKMMQSSYFAGEYFHEMAQSLVDNLNVMYVAFTRACEELHIMLPLPAQKIGKKSSKPADKLKNAATVLFEFFKEKKLFNDDTFIYTSGEKCNSGRNLSSVKPQGISIKNYPASNFKKQLRIKYESDDYFSTSSSTQDRRNYGNLMHRVFASLKTVDDVSQAIASLVDEGVIAKSDLAELKKRIDKAMLNPYAAGWFAAGQNVETERFLLLPESAQDSESRRPDRVITRPHETLVIDYKFGQKEKKTYNTQVNNYMQLLKNMGYPNVKGYVWYVDIDKVVQVNDKT